MWNQALNRVHGGWVFKRRLQVLSSALAERLPSGARVLDIGAGSGEMGTAIGRHRPDIQMRGIDVFVRPKTDYPVDAFDGEHIPHDSNSFDACIIVDVLHHTKDPLTLLLEASRVAPMVIIKDHLREGMLAEETLRAMDWVGNARHGVVLPYNYWNRLQWQAAFERAQLHAEAWQDDVPLYVGPLQMLFGRSLHFVTRLVRAPVAK
jgi:SAM-dependent methyltransferase